MQWLENALDIRESDLQLLTKTEKMDFQIVDNPNQLRHIIEEKNKEKPNLSTVWLDDGRGVRADMIRTLQRRLL